MSYDPDAQRFRDYAEGNTNDSPIESDWAADCPRCEHCNRPIDEDEGCTDIDCQAYQEADYMERTYGTERERLGEK